VIGAEEGIATPVEEAPESASPPGPAVAETNAARWKWLAWAGIVAVIALISRALLRPGSSGRPVP
jgi:hypothetical protein